MNLGKILCFSDLQLTYSEYGAGLVELAYRNTTQKQSWFQAVYIYQAKVHVTYNQSLVNRKKQRRIIFVLLTQGVRFYQDNQNYHDYQVCQDHKPLNIRICDSSDERFCEN